MDNFLLRFFVSLCITVCLLPSGIAQSGQPDYEQISREADRLQHEGMAELERLRNKYDPANTDMGEPVSQEILDMLDSYQRLIDASEFVQRFADKQQNGDADEPDWEQIAKDAERASEEGMDELLKLRDKYDPNTKPEEEPVPEEIKAMLDSYQRLLDVTQELERLRDAQNARDAQEKLKIEVASTGETTGDVFSVKATNGSDVPIELMPQLVYIPSKGKYQSYVARTPGDIVLRPGESTEFMGKGYCTYVHAPPVPAGEGISPNTVIPVEPFPGEKLVYNDTVPQIPEELNPPPTSLKPVRRNYPVFVFNNETESHFTPSSIPDIIASPGFQTEALPTTPSVPTWPGTDAPMGGTFDVTNYPRTYASVVVRAVELIEEAADVVVRSGMYPTPFSKDTARAIEASTQQPIWVFTSYSTGEEYTEADFAENVYAQFENSTGRSVEVLPPEQKDKVDEGVDQFWESFQAVGIEAKVLKPNVEPLNDDVELIGNVRTGCECDSITGSVAVQVQRKQRTGNEDVGAAFNGSLNDPTNVTLPQLKDNSYSILITLTGIKTTCHCTPKGTKELQQSIEEMKSDGSRFQREVQALEKNVSDLNDVLTEIRRLNDIVTQGRDLVAERKLNILWKEYMEDASTNPFDMDNGKGNRDRQIQQLLAAVNQRVTAAEKAVQEKKDVLKNNENLLADERASRSECAVSQGAVRIRVSSTEEEASMVYRVPYRYKDNKIIVKVTYWCKEDNCLKANCEQEFLIAPTYQ